MPLLCVSELGIFLNVCPFPLWCVCVLFDLDRIECDWQLSQILDGYQDVIGQVMLVIAYAAAAGGSQMLDTLLNNYLVPVGLMADTVLSVIICRT